jgi:hypothetical protein
MTTRLKRISTPVAVTLPAAFAAEVLGRRVFDLPRDVEASSERLKPPSARSSPPRCWKDCPSRWRGTSPMPEPSASHPTDGARAATGRVQSHGQPWMRLAAAGRYLPTPRLRARGDILCAARRRYGAEYPAQP